ncbi:MAG: radical SAM protein [Candidatus Desulforudis sp.]|nr:radical SAM protein [Desulforudis sp.]
MLCAVIRVSAGTARVLGLNNINCAIAPTTAYLLFGGDCPRRCGFCARSRESTSGADLLSRVTWPLYPGGEVIDRLVRAGGRGDLGRVCLQVVHDRTAWKRARRTLETIAGLCHVPVSVSCTADTLRDIRNWFDAGAQRFGLALDAAAEEVFHAVKGGGWNRTRALLHAAADQWPGSISTHLIVGLGETDRDLVARLREMTAAGITVGLFAFTPVRGTRLQHHGPPPLSRYRSLQAAHYLIRRGGGTAADDFAYDARGNLVHLGLPAEQLAAALAGGDAFRTSGCPLCNRPFYNERPGKEMYNYPRPLIQAETAAALQALFDMRKGRQGSGAGPVAASRQDVILPWGSGFVAASRRDAFEFVLKPA